MGSPMDQDQASGAEPHSFRYAIIPVEGGQWLVKAPDGELLFVGFEYRFPEEVAAALKALAFEQGVAVTVANNSQGKPMWVEAEAPIGLSPHLEAPARVSTRLTLTLWPELADMLDDMADEMGLGKGETIVKALGLLKTALDARREGKKVILLNEEKDEETEVTGF